MSATIITLKNANFAGLGLPNINPFVAQSEAEYAFDFRPRSDQLVDLTGNKTLTAYRNDIVAGNVGVLDSTVVTTSADNLGVTVSMGYMLINKPRVDLPLDGSVKFSILVVAGWSGIAFPSGSVAGSAATIAGCLDYGTDIGGAGGFCFDDSSNSSRYGVRIKSTVPVISDTKATATKKHFKVLTFDGTNWTVNNRTTGTVTSKTNTDLGLSGTLAAMKSIVPNVSIGHYSNTATTSALYPTIYQIAHWNRVLTQAEIDDQYARSKAAFAALAI